ncbi:hypothetical protein K2173_005013 [Erythroxylum novogranatense]|uniref:DUF7804 domain-containing protein n=1 Tax=Erythroxylum novogranatense TaxID=1862640 RepID=A0AAV8TD14_9ROSI|nr:hypothetical protein K2173_005013 [Erythroxylum novogranatense]
MASVGNNIHWGGSNLLSRRLLSQDQNVMLRKCCVAIPENCEKPKKGMRLRLSNGISMSMKKIEGGSSKTTWDSCLHKYDNGKAKEKMVGGEKLDEWTRGSVVEIVKNLREAPLLVQVYSKNNGQTTTLKTEKAVEQNWPNVIEKWREKGAPIPEGLIFVEQLGEEEVVDHDHGGKNEEGKRGNDIEGGSCFGIVVQGKEVEYGPACYLLKTSSGGSGLGGACCTHFCLMKVKSFRETAMSQLKNCWLVQSQ